MEKLNSEYVLDVVKKYIDQVENSGQTNEQWFIEFEIELSHLATKDHNVTRLIKCL